MTSRVVLITGAAGGLGLAMAEAVLGAGHSLVAADVNGVGLDELVARAPDSGKVLTRTVDLSGGESGDVMGVALGLVDAALDRFGHLDAVVNNAGIGPGSVRKDFQTRPLSFTEISTGTLERFVRVHLGAPLALAQAALGSMTAAGWGRLVNVTTSLPTMLAAGLGPYGAVKAANEAMTSSIATEMNGSGITANVLIPGGRADTNMIPLLPGEDRSVLVQPRMMAPPLLWLLSNDSDNFTGRRIRAAHWDESASPDLVIPMAARPIGWPDWASPATHDGEGAVNASLYDRST